VGEQKEELESHKRVSTAVFKQKSTSPVQQQASAPSLSLPRNYYHCPHLTTQEGQVKVQLKLFVFGVLHLAA
jgi:hypothetical protein